MRAAVEKAILAAAKSARRRVLTYFLHSFVLIAVVEHRTVVA